MEGKYTIDFKEVEPCLKKILGTMAVSDLDIHEYSKASKNIEEILEIWNKKERGVYTGD